MSTPCSQTSEHPPRKVPGEFMLHPVVLVSVTLLALNDHYLKEAYGNWWTGKLSDFAGLIFFPLLLLALLQFGGRALKCDVRMTRRAAFMSIVLTGFIFAGINLSTTGGALYQGAVHFMWNTFSGVATCKAAAIQHVVDPSDLITMPALLIPWKIVGKYSAR